MNNTFDKVMLQYNTILTLTVGNDFLYFLFTVMTTTMQLSCTDDLGCAQQTTNYFYHWHAF